MSCSLSLNRLSAYDQSSPTAVTIPCIFLVYETKCLIYLRRPQQITTTRKMAEIPTSAINAFFTRLLKPIARILLRNGVSFRELNELCKKTYIAVARDEFGVNGRPTNVSRIAMLTGMTRRDVRKVRMSLDDEEQVVLGRMNNATRLLSGWYQDADFTDDAGNPLPLPEFGPTPSFSELARRYAGDIPVTTLLKELKTAGAIENPTDDLLVARTRYYMPGRTTPATAETLLRSGSVLEDIGDTVDFNLGRHPEDDARFERRATNLRIGTENVNEFREFIEKEGQNFLEKVDSWLSDHEVPEAELDQHKTIRLGLGAYWIQDPVTEGVQK